VPNKIQDAAISVVVQVLDADARIIAEKEYKRHCWQVGKCTARGYEVQ
jgi:hypothetical protein